MTHVEAASLAATAILQHRLNPLETGVRVVFARVPCWVFLQKSLVFTALSDKLTATFNPMKFGKKTTVLLGMMLSGFCHSFAGPLIQVEALAGVVIASGSGIVSFPKVNLGESYAKTITIRNKGDAELLLSGATVSGANATEFALVVDSMQSVSTNDNSFMRVLFSPLATGLRVATLTVPSNDPLIGSFTLSLSGTGTQKSGIRYFVKWNATGFNDGSSWTNAFTNLQSAISSAMQGDEIWVTSGTYKPTTGTDRNASFRLKDGVLLYGGFAGTEATLSERDIPSNPTVLSGDLLNNDNVNVLYSEPTRSDNSVHVIATGTTPNNSAAISLPTRLDGFTVEGGNANGSPSHYGGGIYLEFSSLEASNVTVENCVIRNNSCIYDGAGILNTGHARIIGCVFERNRASNAGSALANADQTAPQILNSVFVGNLGNSIVYSGDTYSRPEFINCTFSGNEGGVYNAAFSSAQIRNCIFWGNSQTSPLIFDGATLNTNSPGIVKNNLIQGGWPGDNAGLNPNFLDQTVPKGPDGIWGTGDDGLRIRSFSPAMDSGDNRACTGLIAFDLQGRQRIIDTVEIGAYENLRDTDHDGLPDIYETGTGIYVSQTDTGTDPNKSDSDRDGLTDGVEVFTSGTNPNLADTDDDGFDDAFEINTGFDPKSDSSTPDALSSIRTAVEFRFNAADAVSYRIEDSFDLQTWDTLETNIIGQGGVVTRFYSVEAQPKRYFRVRRN